MNNSDTPLTPYEEKLTAYIDGRLDAAQAAAFEREYPEVAAEKLAASRVRNGLRIHGAAPVMRNGEFFNHQILRQIEEPAPVPAQRVPLFGLWRLAFAGMACLLAVGGIYFASKPRVTAESAYMVQILETKTDDPAITTRIVEEDGMTVVMVDGLADISEDYILN
jgi:anti-sigma factor RsiW